MFSSFHHFRATDAGRVLANAVERSKGIAIFEIARREPKIILAICFIPFLILCPDGIRALPSSAPASAFL
jgi:hypothetical protein